MTTADDLASALTWQANACRALGSPFGGTLLDLAAEGALGPLDDLFARWTGGMAEHVREATTLRLMGALHHLVLIGDAPALAAQYPAERPETDRAALAVAVRDALTAHRTRIAAFMDSPPQTNEVGRSFALAPGFLQIVERFGPALRIFELGSSAGLNLRWDRFAYEFDGHAWGDPASPVRLANGWKGDVPPLPAAMVIERAGCDQAPVDVADEAQALRLQAYVWPDQAERMARLRGAIAIARAVPARLDRADAADWVAGLTLQDGAATVLFHSVMWQYMPDATQAAVRARIDALGAMATPAAPFAWLRMEPSPAQPESAMELRLRLWPEGGERLLARVHPHGAWIRWE